MKPNQLTSVPSHVPASFRRGKALVVDDEHTNRVVLKAMLENANFQVIEAENGATAIELFSREQPDIVFMDIMMPVMDGYEATTKIKAICGNTFVPVIFLTALTDNEVMAAAIQSGGDDFFVKPYNSITLKAKILAMERMRELNNRTHRLLSRMQRDQEIAESLFSDAVTSGNVAMEAIQSVMWSSSTFNGDMLLSEYTLSFDLHVMLGDFTGHGLGAALGALPCSEVFRAMCGKGFSAPEILSSINRKLHSLLPKGMFMAAQYVVVSRNLDFVTVCNCAMPDILIVDGKTGQIKSRVESSSLPLGVSADIDYSTLVKRIPTNPGDRIVLSSDGVARAQNNEGELFGQKRFEQALSKQGDHAPLTSVQSELDDFCKGVAQIDDISLVEIPCLPWIFPQNTIQESPTQPPNPTGCDPMGDQAMERWQYQLKLTGNKLKTVNPVPLIIAQIQELEDIGDHYQSLFTILTELYVNALDHGILNLDSSIKQSPEGFSEYFTEREKRLHELNEGWISFSLDVECSEKIGQINIRIHDSGPGFDIDAVAKPNRDNFHGRGIQLIKELCQSLHFIPPGNQTEAVYAWTETSNNHQSG